MPVLISASTFLGGRKSIFESEESDDNRTRMLVELCVALYRTVIREFLRSIRERIHDREVRVGANYRVRDDYELLAQFSQHIEDHIEPLQLRDYWRRFGFLSPVGIDTALFRRTPLVPTHQGIEEINLLVTVNELFIRAVGTFERWKESNDSTSSSSGNQSQEAKAANELSTWKPLLTGLFSGSVVGVGAGAVSAQAWSPAVLFSSVLAAIGFGWLSTLVPSWTRSRSFTQKEKINKNYSRETLHREIPRVVEALFQAGLCPIFIIDELDKVSGLMQRVDSLLSELKQFFQEDGFFCFLTNRQYFDELSQRAAARPFDLASTFFTNRLFMETGPANVRAFVRRTFSSNGSFPDSDLSEDDKNKKFEAELDRTVMEFLIVAQSGTRMSIVHRLIDRYYDRYQSKCLGDVRGGDGQWRNLIEMAIQMAAEMVLDQLLRSERLSFGTGVVQQFQHLLSRHRLLWQRGQQWHDENDEGCKHSILELLVQLRDDPQSKPLVPENTAATVEVSVELQQMTVDAWQEMTKLLSNSEEFQERTVFHLADDNLKRKLWATLIPLFPIVRPTHVAEMPWEFAYAPDGSRKPPVNRPEERQAVAAPMESLEDAIEAIRVVQQVIAAGELNHG